MSFISITARRRLFLGSALATLSASLAVPALAVVPYPPQIDTAGGQVIADSQIVADTGIEATASDPTIEIVVLSTEASVSLTDNEVQATATANHQSNALEPDSFDLTPAAGGTHLSVDGADIAAYAPAVIAAQQVTENAPVSADTSFSGVGILGDDIVESRLDLTANRLEALATGNDATSALGFSGGEGSTGAGIANVQSTGYASEILAGVSGSAHILTREIVGSEVAMQGNVQRAVGTGNRAASTLSADVLSIDGAASYGPPSTVQPHGGAEVNAAFAVLSSQRTSSDVAADAEGGFHTAAIGSVVESAMRSDGNVLAGAAYGNDARSSADLVANSIDVGNSGGAIANVTSVQTAEGATFADASGGTTMFALGDVVGSTLAANENSIQSAAVANRANGNLLTVDATTIRAPDGFGGEEGGGPEYVGTAIYDGFGVLTVTAPFSVQNAQSFEGPVGASTTDSETRIKVRGDIVNSSVVARNSLARAAATGNRAANGLALYANSIATAADLNSAQSGFGDVTARIGDIYDRAGVLVSARDDLVGASVDVSGNTLQAGAIANDVTNSLAVRGNEIGSASGHFDAAAGQDYDGFLASADYALASFQGVGSGGSTGEEGGETGGFRPLISSGIVGGFEVRGDSVHNSSVTIDGNSQMATALANLASNSLSIDATALGDAGGAPGSALSSTQIAAADLSATSDMRLLAPGYVTGGSVGLRDNSNVALAHMNDAVNRAAIEAVQIGELSGGNGALFTDPGMPGYAVGDHVLANNQMAEGSVTASASTRVRSSGHDDVLFQSRYAVTGNETASEAAANQAVNELTVLAASIGSASAGIASTQESHADVLADAATRIGYRASAMPDAQMIVDSNVTAALARGNAVANNLTVSETSGLGGTPASAELLGTGVVSATAGLANSQLNTGDVRAISDNAVHGIVLNGFGAEGSELVLNGNAVSASAIGNSATNTITLSSLGESPTAAVANVQMNSGRISAEVSGATFAAIPGHLSASRLGITSNSVSASAVGNSAVTSIASSR